MSLSVITSAQHKPAIGLCMDASSSTQLAPLVGALAEFALPLVPEPNREVQAYLASSVHAPTAHLVLDNPETPAIVVVHHEGDLEHPIAQAAQALVVFDEGTLWSVLRHKSGLGEKLFLLTSKPAPSPFPLPVSVPQRAALRRHYGLDDQLVVSVGRPGAPIWNQEDLATALRVAAVVAATGEAATLAMALGAAVVTDCLTATGLGATSGTHLLVAETHEISATAKTLSQDELQMAALGTAGRKLVLARQPISVARAVIQRFNLTCASAWPSAVNARFGARLAELGTPPGHPLEAQFEDRLRRLSMHVQAGGL